MKKTITRKAVLSYLLIILITLVTVGVVLGLSIKTYMERQAMSNLVKDANSISDIFRNSRTSDSATEKNIRQLLKDRLKMGQEIGSIGSEWAVVNRQVKVIFPINADDSLVFKNQVLPLINSDLNKKQVRTRFRLEGNEYMALVQPVREGTGQAIKGWVVLYTPIGPVKQLNRGLFTVLLFSLMITGLIAVVFGVVFAKSMAKPIISLKKRAERLSQRDFESRVEIHTGDELEDLAETMEKMAFELKEYDEAQKKFLQNASHELKTPLMSIQGYAEGLKDGVFDDKEKAFDVIIEESARLKGLVEELIYLSKLETMQDFYSFRDNSINDIIRKSVEKIESLAVKGGIRVSAEFLANDLSIRMDSDKLIQALINVLGNCLRYAKSRICVSARLERQAVQIVILDDGNGFKPFETENIFKRFYKGDKGSTGLGLAITRTVIEKHNGNIEAANAENGGAMFIIRLPVKLA